MKSQFNIQVSKDLDPTRNIHLDGDGSVVISKSTLYNYQQVDFVSVEKLIEELILMNNERKRLRVKHGVSY